MIRRTLPIALAVTIALTLVLTALATPSADPAAYFTANLPPPGNAQAVTALEQALLERLKPYSGFTSGLGQEIPRYGRRATNSSVQPVQGCVLWWLKHGGGRFSW